VILRQGSFEGKDMTHNTEYKAGVIYSDFKLPAENRERISKLIGSGYGDRIEISCQALIGGRENDAFKPSKGEVNKKMRELNRCAVLLSSVLEDVAIQRELNRLVQKQLPTDFLKRQGVGFALLRDDLYTLTEVTENIPPAKTGRPANSIRETEYNFCAQLFLYCREAGKRPKRVNLSGKPAGMLHQLLGILQDCKELEIGHGDLIGIADQIIKNAEGCN
jgi:hypothetical protein